ncbi:MAG: peptide deformylase [Kineosporiaceae bacterium]
MTELRPSDVMARLGIVQADAPILHHACEPIALPRDTRLLSRIITALVRTLDGLATVHDFAKGMGLAAPQIGLPHAVAIVRPPDTAQDQIVLVNPRVIDSSEQTHETYEGCMSFFNVRGFVPRPRSITVEHLLAEDATNATTTFQDSLARLVAHEIDHLHGCLYTARMRPGITPIPVEEYRLAGRPWAY